MVTPPHLVRDGGALHLDVAVGAGRRRLGLSDRAVALLADDLGYGNADVLPWVTARALVLAGGARSPDGADARDAAWTLAGWGGERSVGGRDPTEAELRALADYLRGARVETRAVETLREHVRSTRLSEFLDPADVRHRTDRVQDLSDIARDL